MLHLVISCNAPLQIIKILTLGNLGANALDFERREFFKCTLMFKVRDLDRPCSF
jgi:hypothetical protein